MRVTFVNRSPKFGGFSFEELFKTIKSNLIGVDYQDFYDDFSKGFLNNIKELKRIQTDIYHITGGLGYYALFLPTNKTILTIHDTNHYENDLRGLKKWLFGLIYYRLPIKNVKYVSVVSNHTKNRLIKLFNIHPDKIVVIPNCYPNSFKKKLTPDFNSPINILQIGTKENKNISRLIDALSGLNIRLTIIGKLSPHISKKLTKNNINFANKQNLSSQEIYNEYCNCDIVAFISLHEGFGLPIIEANAVGRAVITSNVSSMPEVADKAACLIDPYSISDIRDGLNHIINNEPYRTSLIENGFENIKRFEPLKIAQRYTELYHRVVNQ